MDEGEREAGQDASVGERLRRAREAQGLTLEDVATRTRIPIRHLRSIEDGNWDDLPAVTYTVGFARSYANAVGLDGVEIGRELRELLGVGERPHAVSPEFYAPPDPARVPSRPLAWIAGLLAIVLVVGYLWWRSSLDDEDQVAEQPQAQQPAQPTTPQPAPNQPPAPQSLAGQPVTLVAAGEVWFRVTDRATNRRVDQTLQSGAQYRVPADFRQPIISTGRPQVLHVVIAGHDLGTLDTEQRTISGVSLLAADLAQRLQAQPAAAQPGTPAGAPPAGNGFSPML